MHSMQDPSEFCGCAATGNYGCALSLYPMVWSKYGNSDYGENPTEFELENRHQEELGILITFLPNIPCMTLLIGSGNKTTCMNPLRVHLPHTIVFNGKLEEPPVWYFSSTDSGEINRRHTCNVTPGI